MNKKKNNKMIFCESCSFKIIIQDDMYLESFTDIKTSPIPGGIPALDQDTGKTKTKQQILQNKKVKCPKCGRGVVVKQLQEAYSSTIKKIKQKDEEEKFEEDRKKRIEDGKPLLKNIDSEYLG